MWHWGDPRRLAYCTGNAAAVAAQNSFVGIYNNSPGQHILCIIDFSQQQSTVAVLAGFAMLNAAIGTIGASGFTAFNSQAAPPGQVLTGSVTALPSPLVYFGGQVPPASNPRDWALAFLEPGDAFVMYAQTVDIALNATVWYEWRWLWEFPAIPENPMVH